MYDRRDGIGQQAHQGFYGKPETEKMEVEFPHLEAA